MWHLILEGIFFIHSTCIFETGVFIGMDKREKLATKPSQTKQKHNTICVWHHYAQKRNIYNIIKLVPTFFWYINQWRSP
jgi:hypothetical protein